jgi:Zn-dependent protease with chaperone function
MTDCARSATDRKRHGNSSPSRAGAAQLASLAGAFSQLGFDRQHPLASQFSTHPLNTDRIKLLRETALETGRELQVERRALPASRSPR